MQFGCALCVKRIHLKLAGVFLKLIQTDPRSKMNSSPESKVQVPHTKQTDPLNSKSEFEQIPHTK